MPVAKFALFAFDTPPWETSDEKVIIGLASWILSCDPEIPSQIVEAREVTVKWPVNKYDNYMKFARKGNTQHFEFTELSAKLLFKSGGELVNICSLSYEAKCYLHKLFLRRPRSPTEKGQLLETWLNCYPRAYFQANKCSQELRRLRS
jgi:hypothetical protein